MSIFNKSPFDNPFGVPKDANRPARLHLFGTSILHAIGVLFNPGPPPPGNFRILENGSRRLLEDGSFRLLE